MHYSHQWFRLVISNATLLTLALLLGAVLLRRTHSPRRWAERCMLLGSAVGLLCQVAYAPLHRYLLRPGSPSWRLTLDAISWLSIATSLALLMFAVGYLACVLRDRRLAVSNHSSSSVGLPGEEVPRRIVDLRIPPFFRVVFVALATLVLLFPLAGMAVYLARLHGPGLNIALRGLFHASFLGGAGLVVWLHRYSARDRRLGRLALVTLLFHFFVTWASLRV